jgi:integration host factor subunit alpha
MNQSSTTKSEIIDALYAKFDLPRNETAILVEHLFEMIRVELEQGRDVKLPGFGNFLIRNKNPRVGRNPKTGEQIEITARKVISFKASSILRDRVQKGGSKKK